MVTYVRRRCDVMRCSRSMRFGGGAIDVVEVALEAVNTRSTVRELVII